MNKIPKHLKEHIEEIEKIKEKYQAEDLQRVIYNPKVSSHERHAGSESNNHATLKPLNLCNKIFSLFHLPIEQQKVLIPFSGVASEYIGVMSTGIPEENITGIEISEEYCEIGKARVKYWKEHDFYFTKESKEQSKVKNNIEKNKNEDSDYNLFDYN